MRNCHEESGDHIIKLNGNNKTSISRVEESQGRVRLTRSDFRDIVVLTHVSQVLIEILNPVTVRLVRFLG